MKKITAFCCLLLLAGCKDAEQRYQGYVEGEYVHVAAPIAGQLLSLQVERGAEVTQGAPLFVLEQAREQAALAEAQARVDTARAQLADLRKGKRTEELEVIRAQLEQARAQLTLSEAQLQRVQDLRERGLSSAEQLDQTRTERQRAQARVNELTAQLRTAELAARADAIRAAEQTVSAAEAQLAQVRWQLQQKTVVAPVAGLVEDTLYRPGEWVPAGAPVVSLLPPQNRIVRFFVPESVIGALRPGRSVRVTCDGCASAIESHVSYVAPRAEFTPPVIYSRETREKLVFLVEAKPAAGQTQQLHPGQPVEVELTP